MYDINQDSIIQGKMNNSNKTKIIACEVLKEEILAVLPEDIKIEFLEFRLHNYPDILRSELQLVIDTSAEYDYLILCYGNCGRGLVGLRARNCCLVIPRVTDCIHLMLGADEYEMERKKEPGTFFLTKGWIERGSDALKDYQQMIEKYGIRKAQLVIRETYKNYKRIALIDTGTYDIKQYLGYAEKLADFINIKQVEVIPGSLSLFKKMVSGCWDEDFKILCPSEVIVPRMY